ncbi:pyruvate kinase [Mycoplasmopsis canis UFG4]|uniref:Pyruvate kinase n=1 Tax=Mycoplasmopsis canis UFG4 TaxID=1131455 RepID=I1A4J3_9BACT|nr:pyruvate kinase [Mycoplasmopsis canis]AKF41388.1 pyruvate kinase [Mycoplasmopsis canis]EIE39322.1 pyruvate kinase [Mycoplasmopsis canis UF33]EIE39629.1 pyruvate kinase [Mycoplasmopsis canis UF31]EIE41264.1 pyruvate kinase [Mycoplasmopsis canis UFG1]EIE41414.1 pyruvate kinase [Mycoplasmopsis canis UFG4]
MKITDKRTKLVATIGPSSDNYETLRQLVENGVTTIRANFSHGSHEEQANKFRIAKQVSKDLQIPVSLMLDTKGPEIRIGKMKDGAQVVEAGTEILIHTTSDKYQSLEGTSKEITVAYDMAKDLEVGNQVLIDDGKLSTVVIEVGEGYVKVKAENTHKLKTNKRVNLPGVDFSLPFLAEKDINDVKFGIKEGINYVAASFVNSAKNVNELRQLLNENGGSHVQIISKIESHLGCMNIDEIIEASDGIMVARGDLGLEIPYYDVPYFQKKMIRKCREAGKMVIVATQMLDSMENSPHPTRAEVTDVYYAVELGADSTMLSGESANGSFPVEAVKTMTAISKRAEKEFYSRNYYERQLEKVWANSDQKDKRSKIAYEIAKKAQNGDYKYIVVLSRTGELLKRVAKFRPNSLTIGILDDEKLLGGFGSYSGVFVSVDSKKLFPLVKEDTSKALEALKPYGIQKGDKYLVVENEKFSEEVVK